MSSGTQRPPPSLPQRTSILPPQPQPTAGNNVNGGSNRTSTSKTSAPSAKTRHLNHLHSQLAQLSANLSDLENLVRMTAVQAESMRGLGGWCGGLFMAASKEFEPEEGAYQNDGREDHLSQAVLGVEEGEQNAQK